MNRALSYFACHCYFRRNFLKPWQSKRSAQQQQQPRSHADRERTQEEERKERSAEALRRLKSYVLDHKV